LGTLIGKYEIILYANEPEDFDVIDAGEQLTTYRVSPLLVEDHLPEWHWKNPRTLNRPFASTVLVDIDALKGFPAPNNFLIVEEWDGKDMQDNKLLHLIELLDHIAKKAVASKTPANEICPLFQSIEKDAVTVWKEKSSSPLFGKFR